MIETLRLERVAIVDEAELEFGPGLNVLTGETGAGKSIVLGALSLLAGGRASSEALREGADEGTVEAVFRTETLVDLEDELEARGLAPEDHELVVHRRVARSGRGRARARIGGQLVPVSALAELFAGRLEISSQHSSQALRRPESHARLLDALGEGRALRAALEVAYEGLRSLDAELATLLAADEERERRRDFLAFQVREIDEAELEPGEEARVATEQARLAHAERLREDGAAAVAALSGDPLAGEGGARDRVADALRKIEVLAGLDPSLEEPASRLRTLASELGELASDLERYVDGVEIDPGRLGALDERLARIDGLRRKYGEDCEAILRFRDRAAGELAALEGADERATKLTAERSAAESHLMAAARALSAARAEAAQQLGERVEKGLAQLGMPKARFDVALEAAPAPEGMPCSPSGMESPLFQLAANPGEPPRPLHKVASGGELSRAFLAIRGALREGAAGMVLVFDEVDAGIGGGAAEKVGRALAGLAKHHQVVCITHLPQIAAFADVHFRVEKRERAGRSIARVERIDGDERVDEIARMAGGARISDATRQHAADLLRSKRKRS